jgi:DNA uptake protein ComE-like DNA-binding protein
MSSRFVDLLTVDGMPVQVPEGSVSGYLRLGYRPIAPEQSSQNPQVDGETGWVDVNKATVTELRSLPLVGVATAKQVIKCRPYRDLAELITKVEGIDWISIESQLVFGDVES